MTTASTFYQLNYRQQADLLLNEGSFLQSRSEDSFIVDLYELDDLLIEVFYQQEGEEIVSVMAYNTTEKLKSLTRGTLKPRLTIKNNVPYQKANESYAA